jgi:hypothetical protein
MMRRRLIIAAAMSVTLLAAGSGVAAGAAVHSHGSPHGLFAGQLLLPGRSAHTDITVKGAGVPVRPYLEISGVRQRCAGATCTGAAPVLAQILQLSASDGAGHTWTRTFATAQQRLALPGGTIAAGHRRTYHLTLALPARTGNSYEGLAVSGHFSWGGLDASNRIVTKSGPGGSSLPFTGLDTLALLAIAGCLLGAGGSLLATAKRRRQR